MTGESPVTSHRVATENIPIPVLAAGRQYSFYTRVKFPSSQKIRSATDQMCPGPREVDSG